MAMYPVNEEFVKKTLRYYDRITEQLNSDVVRETRRIREAMGSDRTDLLRAASLPGHDISVTPVQKSGFSDLQTVCDRYADLDREYVTCSFRSIRTITEKKEAMTRIMLCFQALPDGKEKEVVRYVDMISESTTAGLIDCDSKLGIPDTSAKRLRRNGIKTILKMYRSPLTNKQLAMAGAYERAMSC